jgi:Enoyl-CoA hydratase/isomerase
MLSELAGGINALGERSEIKLIVLDSAGKTFCGGIELGEYTQRRVFQLLDAFHAAFLAMLDTSKPLLVVVNGPAFGGGSATSKTRKKACAPSSKSAPQSGRTADVLPTQLTLRFSRHTLSANNRTGTGIWKAVRIGHGPATVIGTRCTCATI